MEAQPNTFDWFCDSLTAKYMQYTYKENVT